MQLTPTSSPSVLVRSERWERTAEHWVFLQTTGSPVWTLLDSASVLNFTEKIFVSALRTLCPLSFFPKEQVRHTMGNSSYTFFMLGWISANYCVLKVYLQIKSVLQIFCWGLRLLLTMHLIHKFKMLYFEYGYMNSAIWLVRAWSLNPIESMKLWTVRAWGHLNPPHVNWFSQSAATM